MPPEAIMPHDGLKGLGQPPQPGAEEWSDVQDVQDVHTDPREALLEEARGGAPEPDGDTEPEPEDAQPTELDVLRAELAEAQRRMAHRFAEEKEKRRRITRRAEALEQQVRELVSAREAALQPSHIRLEHDADGNPILPVAALRQAALPQARSAQTPAPTDPAVGDPYRRMKSSLIDQDGEYAGVFDRLESLTREVVQGLQEAAQDGESLATADDVVDYLDNSDFGASLRRKYPEIPDWESYVPAIASPRAARRLAEKIRAVKGKPDPEPKAPARAKAAPPSPTTPPAADLTAGVRARIREKALQARSRPTVVDGINLEDAAKMGPEEILALPPATRDRVKAALRKSLAP